jgi:hemerythrin superfamily protein
MTNAISLLKEDHKKVKALLAELAETSDRATRKREDLLGQVALEITVHTAIEEEIFYPAFLAAAKKKETETLYYEAQEEHKAAKVVLADLTGRPFDAVVSRQGEGVERARAAPCQRGRRRDVSRGA